MRRSPWLLIATVSVALSFLFAAGFLGRLGPLVTCGADGAAVCVAWPAPASVALYMVFLGAIAALGAWQSAQWRGTTIARREWVALLVVLAAALVVRVWRIDLAFVGYDEAAAASLVAAWRFEGLFPLMGIVSSVGIPNPPGWPYLLLPVLLAFDSPLAVVSLGIVASLCTLTITWWVARRWLGPWAAIAAAVFYAGAFWAVFLGRSGWQPVFLQVPTILCLDAILILAKRRDPWAVAAAAGWLAVMVQLHYIAAIFAVCIVLAAVPARHILRPVHIAGAVVTALVLLAPFLVYEIQPTVRLQDFARLGGDAGSSARIDLEAWNLFWTVASNGGAAGIAGPSGDALRSELGRWSSLGLIGIPLVAAGLVATVGGWPRGWLGWLLLAWVLMPPLLLARHTYGILFHYLYLALPGMALAVGALAEWTARRAGRIARTTVALALASHVAVSTATLFVVLRHVDGSGEYPGLARPLGLNLAAASAIRARLSPGWQALIGGNPWQVEVLRFSLSYAVPSRVFDDCGGVVPLERDAVYLLDSEHSPAATALLAAGSPVLASVRRPDDTSLVLGPAAEAALARSSLAADRPPACGARGSDRQP